MDTSFNFPRRTVLLILAAALLWPLAQTVGGPAAERPYVILVSIDGFRFDYADRYKAKNILAVRNSGTVAASMVPSFPSITFPNHISIATGLYPEHHGIVGNRFFDTGRNAEYDMRRTGADGSWYMSGTPLWVLAEQQHVIAACMFWPTCDGEIQGVRPTYGKKFDGTFPDEKRVQQVLDWLKLPPEQRPHFLTLYFSDVDSAGHRYGPESLQTAEAVGQVDRMIGKLREGLAALALPVNLILVSDHGMQDVTDGEVIAGEFDKVRTELDGPVAFFYCKDAETIEKTYAKLKKNSKLDIYKREETPASWHFNENPRAGDLVALVKGAAVFTSGEALRRINPISLRGEHGYDPLKFKSMHAIFYAIGPNIGPETQIPSFENVNVYPLIAKILGLKLPEKLDGSPSVLDPIYRP
jgi:alkaline phosphatase D